MGQYLMERDAAWRVIEIHYEEDEGVIPEFGTVAYGHSYNKEGVGPATQLCTLLIPDRLMTFLEGYIMRVHNGEEHRFWRKPE